MQGTVFAVAGRFAALSPEGIKGARQERFASKAWLKQTWQELLELAELGAKGAEVLVHESEPMEDNCRSYIIYTYRNGKGFAERGKKGKKEESA